MSSVYRLFCSQLTNLSSPNQVRFYARWTHRQPAKVILPFEAAPTSLKQEKVIDLNVHTQSEPKSQKQPKSKSEKEKDHAKDSQKIPVAQNSLSVNSVNFKKIKEQQIENIKKIKLSLAQVKVFDDNNEIVYEKCKDNDSRISSLLLKLKSKKDRQKLGQVLVEGWRLIVDGIEAKCRLSYILFSQKEDLNKIRFVLPKTGVKIYKIPYKEIQLWSSVETPPGIFGVFEQPTPENINRASRPFPLQIICDNIRDPGNLGAILRAAAGSGAERVLLTKGCVDLWDQKVLRSAAGAHFRLPVHTGLDWEEIPDFVEENTSVLIADSNTSDLDEKTPETIEDQIPVLPYYSIEYPSYKYVTLIIGGETEGISENSYRFAASRNGLRINIPLQNGVDSLNSGMAAAVIAFEVKKQLYQAWAKAKTDRQNLYAT